ncbi:hypothetical protein [Hyphomicrobium sp. ghe19]|uniref:hypothetical protein n=1 Tax=Hyphomicrobium sp. ghe19 TaxID=2682968 RepID=UPI001366AF29|nr:hypothetical protein HYPP_00116 [Hyphomicrobium sp. ghe19]
MGAGVGGEMVVTVAGARRSLEDKTQEKRGPYRAAAAAMKLRLERDAPQAMKDLESNRLAVLAKTKRLRAKRLKPFDTDP